MYWGLRLMLGTSKKWKVHPTAWVLEKLKIQHSTGRERREVLVVSGIWYHAFSRELNLQIDCIFVVFDIKMISNVAHATLYTFQYTTYILFDIPSIPLYNVLYYTYIGALAFGCYADLIFSFYNCFILNNILYIVFLTLLHIILLYLV